MNTLGQVLHSLNDWQTRVSSGPNWDAPKEATRDSAQLSPCRSQSAWCLRCLLCWEALLRSPQAQIMVQIWYMDKSQDDLSYPCGLEPSLQQLCQLGVLFTGS